MKNIPSNAKLIGFLGLLSMFLGLLATLKVFFFSEYITNFLVNFSITYSAIILSFLGGCLFAFNCLKKDNPALWSLILTVLPSIWAAIALQLPIFKTSLLALGFLIIFEIDKRFFKINFTPIWWLKLRLPLTAVMIVILIIMGFYV